MKIEMGLGYNLKLMNAFNKKRINKKTIGEYEVYH
jgi:hypothetical protein